jgi:hypothetical protein
MKNLTYDFELIKQKGKYWSKSHHSRYYFNKDFLEKEVLKLTQTTMDGKLISKYTYNVYKDIVEKCKAYYDVYTDNIYVKYAYNSQECYNLEKKLEDFFTLNPDDYIYSSSGYEKAQDRTYLYFM